MWKRYEESHEVFLDDDKVHSDACEQNPEQREDGAKCGRTACPRALEWSVCDVLRVDYKGTDEKKSAKCKL